MKLLNSKSSPGSSSAADTVTRADSTDAAYLFQTAYGSSPILYRTSASAVCVCTKDDHCFSETLNYVMKLSTNIEAYIVVFCFN